MRSRQRLDGVPTADSSGEVMEFSARPWQALPGRPGAGCGRSVPGFSWCALVAVSLQRFHPLRRQP